MATITETIGTTGRDRSTIVLWEANLDDDPTYDAADVAIGECYDDSAFDETITIDGGGTIGLASITLTVASAERHDGTEGTGARIDRSAVAKPILKHNVGINSEIEWLELAFTGAFSGDAKFFEAVNADSYTLTIRRLICHGIDNSNAFQDVEGILFPGKTSPVFNAHNIIMYDLSSDVTQTGKGVVGFKSGTGVGVDKIQNITIHNLVITSASASGDVHCFELADDASATMQNCIATDPSNAGSGAELCYDISSYANATVSHNLASDTTASGTGSLDSKTAANQFVSTTGGSEDLHLKSGADAIDVGTDLGTTPSGVQFDIDNRDRDAEGDTWDMGADEFVAAVAAAVSLVMAPYVPT